MQRHSILVTGGAGFIGSHLVDALIENGHHVRILDSIVEQVHGGNLPEHLNKKAEFIRADVCDVGAVAKALDGIEVVYHEAAEVGVGQSMYEIVRYVKANDLGTAVLLEEMIKRPTQFKKLVVASSMSIYGEGAYFCPACNLTINPQLRSDEKLSAHDWDFMCDACGGGFRQKGRPKKSPCSRPQSMRSQSRTRSNIAWRSEEHIRSRPWRFDILMFTARGKRFRIHIPVCAQYSRQG